MEYRSILLRQIIAGLLIILFSSCLYEQSAPIASSFSIEVSEDKTSPVVAQLKNESFGADEYEWIFEGVLPNSGRYRIVYFAIQEGAYTLCC